MERVIEPEWLDELPANEPSAIGSRADLRRINGFMNNAGIVARALRRISKPKRVLDLGSGDGALAWRIAQKLGWRDIEFLLLDRKVSIPSGVRDKFAALSCSVTPVHRDALDGLTDIGYVDVVFTNLFLHHFTDSELQRLLADVSAHCDAFVACEPRRSAFALFGSRCVGLLGCNAVTRHDAVASVRAGFRNDEISLLWPARTGWSLSERAAGLFSHCFIAQKL
jgi:SAM-dependent methyltransferase